MASLSSNLSENRLRVNFQMTKARIPMSAIPPATDSPMIDPVLRLELSPELLPVSVEEEVEGLATLEEEDAEKGTVVISVIVWPWAFVVST